MKGWCHKSVATLAFATIVQIPSIAFAINLTGEWTGSISCTAFDGTSFRIPRSTSSLFISHSASAFAAHLEGGEGPTDYSGQAVQQSGVSARLQGIMVECHTTPSLTDRSEVVHLKATESSSAARLKGSSIFRDQGGDIGTCRWSFKRANKNDPGLSDCP
jgi:hypothetical protein